MATGDPGAPSDRRSLLFRTLDAGTVPNHGTRSSIEWPLISSASYWSLAYP